MAKLNEKDFKSHCQNKIIENLYFLYGEEKFLVKQYTQYLLKKMDADEENQFNFHKFSNCNNIDEINSVLNIIPFMSEKNIVFVQDLDFDGLNAVNKDKLLEMLQNIPETSVLIISQYTLDLKSTTQQSNIIKVIQKNGIVVEFVKKTINDLINQVIRWGKKYEAEISKTQAKNIIDLASTDLNTLKNEVEKLASFCAGRPVTDSDIEDIITKNSEYKIFQLSDSIIRGEMDKAFKQLDYLFYTKEYPEVILRVIASAYIDMYRVRVAIENGYKSYEVGQFFNYKKREFLLEKAEKNSWRISTAKLRDMILRIYEADKQIKTTSSHPKLVIETLISDLLVIRGKNY